MRDRRDSRDEEDVIYENCVNSMVVQRHWKPRIYRRAEVVEELKISIDKG